MMKVIVDGGVSRGGKVGVGKTLFVKKVLKVLSSSDETYFPTMGVELQSDMKHSMRFWDLGSKFRGMGYGYYKDAKALIVVIDVTNRSSMKEAVGICSTFRKMNGEDAPIALVFNKVDVDLRHWQCTQEEINGIRGRGVRVFYHSNAYDKYDASDDILNYLKTSVMSRRLR